MRELDFLNKLIAEHKLELIEPSENLAESYEKKSRNCLMSAKILSKNDLFENAIGEAYYAMYNSIQSLFFKCGIKCKNHSAAVIILKKVFCLKEIHTMFSEAKEERIDKQYYTPTTQTNPATKESTQNLINIAERFTLNVNSCKTNLNLEDIDKIRKNFKELLGFEN